MINKIKNKLGFDNCTKKQLLYIIIIPLLIGLLGVISKDSPLNILIGISGAFYVAYYAVFSTKYSFLFGILYVSLYTFVCLQNRVMLDALQNLVLIPIYIASYYHWGKSSVKPENLDKKHTFMLLVSAIAVLVALYFISFILHGNYSFLDSLNTTCTLYAMLLGYYGMSLNWAFWSINNVASAIVFFLALFTPTGSITVFAMKMIFVINGFIGWYNFTKLGKVKNNEEN